MLRRRPSGPPPPPRVDEPSSTQRRGRSVVKCLRACLEVKGECSVERARHASRREREQRRRVGAPPLRYRRTHQDGSERAARAASVPEVPPRAPNGPKCARFSYVDAQWGLDIYIEAKTRRRSRPPTPSPASARAGAARQERREQADRRQERAQLEHVLDARDVGDLARAAPRRYRRARTRGRRTDPRPFRLETARAPGHRRRSPETPTRGSARSARSDTPVQNRFAYGNASVNGRTPRIENQMTNLRPNRSPSAPPTTVPTATAAR